MKEISAEDEDSGYDYMDSELDFNVICNMVSILPAKYDLVSEVEDSDENFDLEDLEKYRPMYYYVTNYGCVDKQKAMFEKPNGSMKSPLKPLFIQARVDDVGVNKVLVD